jgi:diacylglycerol kinase (ATP)
MGRRVLVLVNERKLRGRKGDFYRAVFDRLTALGHTLIQREVTPAAGPIDTAIPAGAFDQVVIAGGDGTVNRVLQTWDSPRVPLAIIPLGTCNLVAKECGYPGTVDGVAAIIDGNHHRPIHIAKANGVACAIATGCGIDSFVLDSISWRWKRRLGRVYLAWKSCVNLVRYRAPRFEVTVDGSPVQGSAVCVLKGLYYAGPFSFTPEASLFDPLLYSVVNEHDSAWTQFRAVLAIFTRDTRRLGEILTIRPAREVEILGPAGFPVQVDGDVRLRTPIRITVSDVPFLMCVPPERAAIPAA